MLLRSQFERRSRERDYARTARNARNAFSQETNDEHDHCDPTVSICAQGRHLTFSTSVCHAQPHICCPLNCAAMSVAQAIARLGHAPTRLCNLHSASPGLCHSASGWSYVFNITQPFDSMVRCCRSHRPAVLAPASRRESSSFRKYVSHAEDSVTRAN